MTYLILDMAFLIVAAVVAVLARRRIAVAAIALTVAVLLVMTAVFDNAIIAAGLVDYDPQHLLGVRIGRAPVEDFAYPLAAALLLPALWHLLDRGRPGGAGPARTHRRDPDVEEAR